MIYDQEPNPLAPHAYWHDLASGTYLVVEPRKGHSVIFRARRTVEAAKSEARRRGMRPLYAVRVRMKAA